MGVKQSKKKEEKIKFFSPSYKRANSCITQSYIPACKYVVAEFEADEYLKNGLDCWVIPDEAQGSVARVRNYILDNCKSKQVVLPRSPAC